MFDSTYIGYVFFREIFFSNNKIGNFYYELKENELFKNVFMFRYYILDIMFS